MRNLSLERREIDLRIRLLLGLPMVEDADDFLGACSEAIDERDEQIKELDEEIAELEHDQEKAIDEKNETIKELEDTIAAQKREIEALQRAEKD